MYTVRPIAGWFMAFTNRLDPREALRSAVARAIALSCRRQEGSYPLATQARYQVSSQVINEVIDGEAVMIDLATGSYYSLNDIGSAIWSSIEAGASHAEIVEMLAQRYDAPLPEIEPAVDELLDRLEREGLVAVAPAVASEPARQHETTVLPGQRLPFEPPRLDKYDDMQDLILLDPVHEVQQERGWPHVNPDVHASGS
jgi:hypothetical protein